MIQWLVNIYGKKTTNKMRVIFQGETKMDTN